MINDNDEMLANLQLAFLAPRHQKKEKEKDFKFLFSNLILDANLNLKKNQKYFSFFFGFHPSSSGCSTG
jgi:hypothetical protein